MVPILSQDQFAYRKTIALASIILALAVILGAFGAHGLKSKLSTHQLSIFETGIRYHFIHGLALLAIAGLHDFITTRQMKTLSVLLSLGIILFSGSLYLLATRELFGIEHWKFLGLLTPIGGLLFVIAWLYLAYISFGKKRL